MVDASQRSVDARRARYRVGAFLRLGLRVSILAGDTTLPAELLDITYSGAGLIAGIGFEPQVGQPILLEFDAHSLRFPMLVQGVVRNIKTIQGGSRIGVSFRDAGEVDGKLPRALVPVFNRRDCFRVAPMPSPGIIVKCSAMGGREASLRLADVSLMGAGLFAAVPEERILAKGDHTTLHFDLPGAPGPIVCMSIVVYEHKLPVGVRYGVRHLPDKCDDFQTLERAVGDYILNRQRSVLRQP